MENQIHWMEERYRDHLKELAKVINTLSEIEQKRPTPHNCSTRVSGNLYGSSTKSIYYSWALLPCS